MTEALSQLAGVLWALSLLVLVLAAHVTLGYVRNGQRATAAAVRGVCGAAAALALGSTLWAAMALGIGSEGLSYPAGFAPLDLLGAWAVAVAVSALGLWPVLRWTQTGVIVGAGLVLGVGALVTRMLLLRALDVRPGFEWASAALVVSALTGAAGGVAGLWIGSRHGARGRLRRGWRWAAALAMGGAAMAAQELTLAAAPLQLQKASAHSHEIALAAVCVLGALALPLVLMLLQLDLYRRTLLFEGVKREERRLRRQRRKAEAAGG